MSTPPASFAFAREPMSARLLLALRRDTALAAVVIAALALLGWLLDVAVLQSGRAGLATMKVNTALSCLLLGGAQLLADRHRATGAAMAGAAWLLGAATLLQYVAGVDLGIDQLLFVDHGDLDHPGRMAPATAIAIILQGAAIWMRLQGRYRAAQLLALPVALIGMLAMVGYSNDADSLYRLSGFSSVSVPTSAAIVLLAISLLFLEPLQGPMRLMAGDSMGSVIARWLMPSAIVTPIFLSWLGRLGESAGLYDANTEAALVAIAMITVLGSVIYVVANGLEQVDLDRRRALQAEAAVSRRLRHANVELHQFAYSISHDIRGPLATILGLSRLADEDILEGKTEDAHHSILEIGRSVASLMQLVQDTLDLTRTDLLEEAFSSVPVARLARQVCREMERPAADKNVRLLVRTNGEANLETEPTRLKCVLQNLVENAIKYHDPAKTDRWVRIGVRSSPSQGVRIEVADNGLGIPESNWKDVFTVYRRFHPDVAEGSGIGLALVRRQVACLGGAIQFHSNSEGTTFTVRLPPQDRHWSEADAAEPATPAYEV